MIVALLVLSVLIASLQIVSLRMMRAARDRSDALRDQLGQTQTLLRARQGVIATEERSHAPLVSPSLRHLSRMSPQGKTWEPGDDT